MKQIKTVCDIAEVKFPPSTHTVLFILDQSSCHWKYDEKALVARNSLLKDGGFGLSETLFGLGSHNQWFYQMAVQKD